MPNYNSPLLVGEKKRKGRKKIVEKREEKGRGREKKVKKKKLK